MVPPGAFVYITSVMARRHRRRRRIEGAAVLRVAAGLARVLMVVLVAVAVGYASYAALRWAADSAAP